MLRIEHVALYTADLEAARDFFVRYFHATAGPLYHNPTKQFRSYFLTFPSGGARLELMTRPALLPPASAESLGYAHIALSVGSPAEVDTLTERLRPVTVTKCSTGHASPATDTTRASSPPSTVSRSRSRSDWVC